MQSVIETSVGYKISRNKKARVRQALVDPILIQREVMNRSLFEFVQYFWPQVVNDPFVSNWHIPYLCGELEKIAERVGSKKLKENDLIVNIPPGTTKTKLVSVFFPVWAWTKWHWLRFITVSYSATLALESAEDSRDLIRSDKFKEIYPELRIKEDKDTKSNYKLIKTKRIDEHGNILEQPRTLLGGNRFSTSVGGTLTGFHGHILIWDDPVNPHQSVSEVERATANRWIDQTLSQRKTDKAISTTIGIMQRLHEDDPTGHLLAKRKKNLKHICLPGQIRDYKEQLKPPELEKYYTDGLLDKNRMPWPVLEEMETDLGQYGYAGQVGQKPTPPKGGMFKSHMFSIVHNIPGSAFIEKTIRYWDKAGTKEISDPKKSNAPAYTVGTKMAKLKDGKWLVLDVVRGRWSSEERERVIRQTAEADGRDVDVYVEQEPGSGGKESAESTIKNLAGFVIRAELPKGDKVYRADPYSVQVNNGNVQLLYGNWNKEFIDEHTNFPFSRFKDQVDSAAAGFSKLTSKKRVKPLGGR